MRNLLLSLVFVALGIGSAYGQSQTIPLANVLANCNTPNSTYTAGQNKSLTQNTGGQLCISGIATIDTITTITDPVKIIGGNGTTIASVSNPVPVGGPYIKGSTTEATASTNSTTISSSATRLVGLILQSHATTKYYALFYNVASPTCNSDTIQWYVEIPANTNDASITISLPFGVYFDTALGICIAAAKDGTGNAEAGVYVTPFYTYTP